jgi:hypothetical protein
MLGYDVSERWADEADKLAAEAGCKGEWFTHGGAHIEALFMIGETPLPAVAVLVRVFGVTLEDIARDIGISRPFLYRCFDGQKKLTPARYRVVLEVLDDVLKGARSRLDQTLDTPNCLFALLVVEHCEAILAREQDRAG